jgi:cholesterol oxidase
MLGASRNPKLFDGDLALKELAKEIGKEDQFEHPDVAVFFWKTRRKSKGSLF